MNMTMAMFMIVLMRMPLGQGGRRGEHEPSSLNPLGADQRVGQLTDNPRLPAQQDHFETSLGIEMNMRGRDHAFEMKMLQFGQSVGHTSDVMVINERDNPHRQGVVMSDRFFDEGVAHQAANRLAPVGVAVFLAIAVEPPEQFPADGHAESNERLFHESLPGGDQKSCGPLPPL
jgi:hypothetical protein